MLGPPHWGINAADGCPHGERPGPPLSISVPGECESSTWFRGAVGEGGSGLRTTTTAATMTARATCCTLGRRRTQLRPGQGERQVSRTPALGTMAREQRRPAASRFDRRQSRDFPPAVNVEGIQALAARPHIRTPRTSPVEDHLLSARSGLPLPLSSAYLSMRWHTMVRVVLTTTPERVIAAQVAAAGRGKSFSVVHS